MYVIKLELKLNNTERTLMAQYSGFRRFVYNYRDFLQTLTTEISQKYHCIRIEYLNISGMMANSKLSDVITNLGLYE